MQNRAKVVVWSCVVAVPVIAAVVTGRRIHAQREAEAALAARQVRRAELLAPLLEFAQARTPDIETPEEIQELLKLADRQTVETSGNIMYVFEKCGFNNEEGHCSFYLLVDQQEECEPKIVTAEIICPEW